MSKINVMIVGVGGQGTLLASRLLGAALGADGSDIKVSEVHGMSQRGGSVVTYVRADETVHSPVIEEGEADIILAFEQLEAARWLPYLKSGGVMIVNDQKLLPMPVVTGAMQYPEDLTGKLKAAGIKMVVVDALALATEAGSVKSVNVVLIGVMAKAMGFSSELWLDAIKSTVPERFLQLNLKAFELGFNTDTI